MLIEKLFGEVPASVLKYSSGCRSKDVFTSTLNFDKLISDAFGGQIPKDYHCWSCGSLEYCSVQCIVNKDTRGWLQQKEKQRLIPKEQREEWRGGNKRVSSDPSEALYAPLGSSVKEVSSVLVTVDGSLQLGAWPVIRCQSAGMKPISGIEVYELAELIDGVQAWKTREGSNKLPRGSVVLPPVSSPGGY